MVFDAQTVWRQQQSTMLNDYENAKLARQRKDASEAVVNMIARALQDAFRANPDVVPGHADPWDIARRVVADPANGLGG